MTAKEQLMATLGEVPDDASMDELFGLLDSMRPGTYSGWSMGPQRLTNEQVRYALRPENVRYAVQELSPDATFESLLEQCIFRDKIDEGLRQLDEGNVVSDEEVRRRAQQWLK